MKQICLGTIITLRMQKEGQRLNHFQESFVKV